MFKTNHSRRVYMASTNLKYWAKLSSFYGKFSQKKFHFFQTHSKRSFEASADVIACCGAPHDWGEEPSSNYACCTIIKISRPIKVRPPKELRDICTHLKRSSLPTNGKDRYAARIHGERLLRSCKDRWSPCLYVDSNSADNKE